MSARVERTHHLNSFLKNKVLTFLWLQVSVQRVQLENPKVGQHLQSHSQLLHYFWFKCVWQKLQILGMGMASVGAIIVNDHQSNPISTLCLFFPSSYLQTDVPEWESLSVYKHSLSCVPTDHRGHMKNFVLGNDHQGREVGKNRQDIFRFHMTVNTCADTLFILKFVSHTMSWIINFKTHLLKQGMQGRVFRILLKKSTKMN